MFSKNKAELRNAVKILQDPQDVAMICQWHYENSINEFKWFPIVYKLFGVNCAKVSCSHEAFLRVIHPNNKAKVDVAWKNNLKTAQP